MADNEHDDPEEDARTVTQRESEASITFHLAQLQILILRRQEDVWHDGFVAGRRSALDGMSRGDDDGHIPASSADLGIFLGMSEEQT